MIRDLDVGLWLLNCSDTDKNQKKMTETKTNTKKTKTNTKNTKTKTAV